MDLVSAALLSLFAAAAAGGLLGFLIARFSRFEVGLSVALMLFGAVSLGFAGRCFLEYRAFAHAGANAAWGEVIAIEDRPVNASGSVTSPVPVVRFTAPDATTHVVQGPASGGMALGSHVNVIYDRRDPQRSRVGQVAELRGGAIALLLFGTFPFSFGAWLLMAKGPAGQPRAHKRSERRQSLARRAPQAVPEAAPSRLRTGILVALNAALAGAILWIGLAPGELQQRMVEGFGGVAAVCAAYALWGGLGGASGAWRAGMIVLAVNFSVWAFALALLR